MPWPVIIIGVAKIVCVIVVIIWMNDEGETQCGAVCNGKEYKSEWCPAGTQARCSCRPEFHWECDGTDRRRLQEDEIVEFEYDGNQVPFTSECLYNDTCTQLLVGYSLSQSAEERCDDINVTCSPGELELFEDVIEEIEANIVCPECECNSTYAPTSDPTVEPTTNTPTTSSPTTASPTTSEPTTDSPTTSNPTTATPTTNSPTTSDPTIDPTFCNQDKYIVVDDGIERTWQEAREFCYDEYETDLATITDVNDTDLECAVRNLNTSAWTGIYSPTNGTYCYEFTNGECPMLDTCECVANTSWLYGGPLLSTQTSQCVHYIPNYGRIHNDISCGEKLVGVICNAALFIPMIPLVLPRLISMCAMECDNGWAMKICPRPLIAKCWCDSNEDPQSGCMVPLL